jgi:hypothetical protein
MSPCSPQARRSTRRSERKPAERWPSTASRRAIGPSTAAGGAHNGFRGIARTSAPGHERQSRRGIIRRPYRRAVRGRRQHARRARAVSLIGAAPGLHLLRRKARQEGYRSRCGIRGRAADRRRAPPGEAQRLRAARARRSSAAAAPACTRSCLKERQADASGDLGIRPADRFKRIGHWDGSHTRHSATSPCNGR